MKRVAEWKLEDRGGERFEKYLGCRTDDRFDVVGERQRIVEDYTEVTRHVLTSCCTQTWKSSKDLETGLVTL